MWWGPIVAEDEDFWTGNRWKALVDPAKHAQELGAMPGHKSSSGKKKEPKSICPRCRLREKRLSKNGMYSSYCTPCTAEVNREYREKK